MGTMIVSIIIDYMRLSTMAKKKKRNKQNLSYKHYPSMFSKPSKRPRGHGVVGTLDTEAIGLVPQVRYDDSTSSHVIVIKDKETDQTFVFFDPYEKRDKKARVFLDEWEGQQDGFLQDGIKFINEMDVVIAQNWLGYDKHALDKMFPNTLKVNYEAPPRGGKARRKKYPFRVMDTLVMSQLLNPERRPPPQAYALNKGNVPPHSIEAHGIRIGRYKPDNEDWSKLTDHMIHRCWEDVAIGESLFDHLWEEWKEQSAVYPRTGLTIKDAYRMEAVMYDEMALQAQRGFRLDLHHAHKMLGVYDEDVSRILKHAIPHMPKRIAKAKLDHAKLTASAERNGYFNLIEGSDQRREIVQPLDSDEQKEYDKKRFKLWKKKGGKKKDFIKSRVKVTYGRGEITHGSSRATQWGFVTKAGNYSAQTKKDYPEEAIGNPDDWKDPIIVGPYTPIVWEQVSLGNRDIVRQVLYEYGWRGVNLTDSEADYADEHGEIPYYYAGKLDQMSIEAWKDRCHKDRQPPEWAIDILKYYIVSHRRGQTSNKGDMEYFKENGKFPNHKGKPTLRGLVGSARCQASGLTIQQLIEKFGYDWWAKKRFDEKGDYRVPAEAFAIGTNTFRMRHKCVVNIPGRGLYGKEMRQLFIASDGWKVLGADGAGLELRMLSHFMEDKEYESIILDGDIHTHNQNLAGLPLRDQAKTFIYAFLYGSGIAGLALTCGLTVSKMQKVVAKFLDELPLLKELIENVQAAAESKGHLVAVDGRWGRVRKSGGKIKVHTCLNVLLQMTGSLCMKWGLYFARKLLKDAGIPCRFVANVHDEVQMEVKAPEVEYLDYTIKADKWKDEEKKVVHHTSGHYYSAPKIVGKTKKGKLKIQRSFHLAGHLLCQGFEEAGTYLNINTPLAGEYMIGNNWADTH